MKKLIDDRGRLFGCISIIDLIVLIVVILLAIAMFTRFRESETPLTTSNMVKVTYIVKNPRTRANIAELIRPGDNLYTEFGIFIGVIVDVSSVESTSPEALIDGTYVVARAEERYDIILTVEANCSFIDGRYYADRIFELSANSEQRMTTKYNIFTGVIMTITAG